MARGRTGTLAGISETQIGMDSSASSNKSPSKMLEKLGNMLLESARALAASRNHDHTGDDHGGSLPQSSRRRHPSWSPEQLSDVTTVDDNEPSDRESYSVIYIYKFSMICM